MKYKDIKNNKLEMKIFETYCYTHYCKELYDSWRIREYDTILKTMDYELYSLNYHFAEVGKEINKTINNLFNKITK